MTFYMGFFTAFALATIRATVFLVFCPPFNNRALTGRVKAMLGAAMGLGCMTRVEPVFHSDTFIFEVVIQGFIGFSMALMVRVMITALQMAGSMIDLEGGFAMAQTFDPLTLNNQATFGRIYEISTLTMLFATNAYQLLILGLARSFTALPVGMMFDINNYAERLVFRFGELMVSALEIAGPLLLVLVLTDMGLGLLTKVAPAMNAFTLGFPMKILMTIFLVPTLMVVVPQLVTKIVDQALQSLSGVML